MTRTFDRDVFQATTYVGPKTSITADRGLVDLDVSCALIVGGVVTLTRVQARAIVDLLIDALTQAAGRGIGGE